MHIETVYAKNLVFVHVTLSNTVELKEANC